MDTKFGGTKPKWLISEMTCNTSNRYATSSRDNTFVSSHRIGLFQLNIFIRDGMGMYMQSVANAIMVAALPK